MFSRIIHLLERTRSALAAARSVWKRGGIVPITVSSVVWEKALENRLIVITGGGSGIGLAIAKQCAASGANVVLVGRSPDRLKSAAASINSSRVTWIACDITNQEENRDLLKKIVDSSGPFDALVNCAGVLGGASDFLDLTEQRWNETIDTNMKALVFLCKSAITYWLKEERKGKILNISSMRSVLGVSDGPYGMSKWALNGLTAGLARKYAAKGILVNGIAPGIINTESISIKGIDPEENAFLNNVPVGRIGLPTEVGILAAYLLSDASNYIIGQTIVIDGGYSLKI